MLVRDSCVTKSLGLYFVFLVIVLSVDYIISILPRLRSASVTFDTCARTHRYQILKHFVLSSVSSWYKLIHYAFIYCPLNGIHNEGSDTAYSQASEKDTCSLISIRLTSNCNCTLWGSPSAIRARIVSQKRRTFTTRCTGRGEKVGLRLHAGLDYIERENRCPCYHAC